LLRNSLCMFATQAHGLDRDWLQKREVIKIDVANDPVDRRVCAGV